MPKLQLDSSELGSAGFGDELDVGAGAVGVADSVGCTGAGVVCG